MVAAVYAIQTYNQTKRQADIARWALENTDRPALYVDTGGIRFDHVMGGVLTLHIHDIALNPAILNYVEIHSAPIEPSGIWTSTDECAVKMGDRIVDVSSSVDIPCRFALSGLKGSAHVYDLIGYRSVENTRWTRRFDSLWLPTAGDWVLDASSPINREYRTDGQGNELNEPK